MKVGRGERRPTEIRRYKGKRAGYDCDIERLDEEGHEET